LESFLSLIDYANIKIELNQNFYFNRLFYKYSIISVGEILFAGFKASIRFRSTFRSSYNTIPE